MIMFKEILDAYNEVITLGIPVDHDETLETYVVGSDLMVTFGVWENGDIYIVVEDTETYQHLYTDEIKRYGLGNMDKEEVKQTLKNLRAFVC